MSQAPKSVWTLGDGNDQNRHFVQSEERLQSSRAFVKCLPQTDQVYNPFQTTDVNTAPPSVGIEQHSTTILIHKKKGRYSLVVDGVEVETNDRNECWLPRFCDIHATESTPRTAGPVCVGLRVEEGDAAPTSATVNMRQSILDGGTVLLDAEEVFQKPEQIEVHRPYDTTAGFNLLPYPAAIVRPPTVTILDMAERRRWEFKRRKWNNSRTWDVIKAVGSTVGLFSNSTTGASLESLVGTWMNNGSGDLAKSMWQLALFKASPTIANLVSTGWTVLSFPFKQYDAREPPPTIMKTYQFSITQLTAALHKIADTNSDTGGVEGSPKELHPYLFGIQGYKAEGALLEYLLFGNSSKLDAATSGIADPVDDGNASGVVWSTLTNPFPSFLRWNTKELTGNLLNPATLNLSICAQTRVEYAIHITIADETIEGGYKIFILRPLLHNAIDAGLIYNDIEGQYRQLELATERVEATLTKLSSFGLTQTWLHDRMYVSSTNNSGSIFSTDTLKRIFQEVKSTITLSTSSDEEKKTRWGALKPRKGTSSQPPIVFSASEFKARLNRILHGVSKTREEGEALADSRRANVIGSGERWFSAGVSVEAYESGLEQRKELYRHTIGASEAYTEGVAQTRAFWRFVDTFIPHGLIDDLRLEQFLVPALGHVKSKPMIVQRLPQIGIPNSKRLSVFGTVSMIPTRPIPDSVTSERKGAKTAVEQTRQCWSKTADVYSKLNWVAEVKPLHTSNVNAFHFFILYDSESNDARDLLLASPPLKPVRSGLTNTLITTGCQPSHVTNLEHLYATAHPQTKNEQSQKKAGDSQLLGELRLQPTRTNLLAVHAFAAISSARAFSIANGDSDKDGISIERIADLIEEIFGTSSKVRGSVYEDDILFACFPEGREAVRVLFHLNSWNDFQFRLGETEADALLLPAEGLEPYQSKHVTEFARSLYKISTSIDAKLLARIPVTPYQCMWFSDNSFIKRLQATDERYSGKPGTQVQYEAALQSWQRVKSMTFVEDSSIPLHAAATALACVVASRPVLQLGPKIEFRHVAVVVDATVDGAKASYFGQMPLRVLSHLRFRAAYMRVQETGILTSALAHMNIYGHPSVPPAQSKLTFRVPAGAPLSEVGSSVSESISYTTQLEDVAVDPFLVSSLFTAPGDLFTADTYTSCKLTVSPFALNGQEDGMGKLIHPHEMRVKKDASTNRQRWGLYLSSLPDFETAFDCNMIDASTCENGSTLSISQHDPMRMLKHAHMGGTWTFHNPIRSLMFNADRICQLVALAEVEDSETGALVVDLSGDEFKSPYRVVLVSVACILGQCIAVAQLGCFTRHTVHVRHYLNAESDIEFVKSKLGRFENMMRGLNGRPAPLSEVCVSASVCLFA